MSCAEACKKHILITLYFFDSLEEKHANHTFIQNTISSLLLRRAGHSLKLLNRQFSSCKSVFF